MILFFLNSKIHRGNFNKERQWSPSKNTSSGQKQPATNATSKTKEALTLSTVHPSFLSIPSVGSLFGETARGF